MDRGHKEADRDLKKLEKRLKQEYDKAAKSMESKLNQRLEKFKKRDEEQKAKVESGEMTYGQYIQWREQYMLRSDAMKGAVQDLAKDMNGMNNKAAGLVNGNMLDAFANNYNYGAYEVCKESNMNLNFELVDRRTVERLVRDNPKLMPKYTPKNKKDMEWNEKKIRESLTQSIMRGDSIPNMAKDLKRVANMDREQAVRAARTMTTAAESAGRMEVYHDAEAMGIQMQKTWIATLDDRTRDAHIELDGVTVDIDEPFVNSIGKIMYPADPDCDDLENVMNCRCTLISSIKGYDRDLSGRQMAESLGGMSYDEWKEQAMERMYAPEEAAMALDEIQPAEDMEHVEDFIAEVDPEDASKTWEEKAADLADLSWDDMHEMMVPDKDSYIYTDEYKEASEEHTKYWNEEKAANDEMRQLREEIKDERMPKPKDEWTLEDEISAMLGEKPYAFTERGNEINERMEELRKISDEAGKKAEQSQEIIDEMDKRAREKELREWNQQEHPFVKGDIDKDYDGFSTTMRIAQYDEDLRAGKGFIAEMSPDEYLDRISYDIFNQSRERTTQVVYENVKEYAEMMAGGTKFDMGYINYNGGRGGEFGQEGRHRAMAAKCLGIEKIPVYIIPDML